MTPTPDTMSKEIKVRVAVAMNTRGQWVAYGDSRETEAQNRANAKDCFTEQTQIFWLEALIDAPSFEDEDVAVFVTKDNPMTKPTGRPRGPRPVDGISRTTMIGSKITEADLKALRAVMKAAGIATQSAAVTLAIRAFAKAHGITVQADDPRQLALDGK